MEKEPEGLYRSSRFNIDEKGSCVGRSLCTQITANLQSMSFQTFHEPKADIQNREREALFSKKMDEVTAPIMETEIFEQQSFESSLYSKFNDLEQRTSRVINLLPQFHSRVRTSEVIPFESFESHLPQGESQISNKLKIIKDLQCKIMQLESNISNPKACREDVLKIEKEINLNFENYYAESRDSRASSHNAASPNPSIESAPFATKQQMLAASLKNNSIFEAKQQHISSYDVCIIIPKIIEIEVPLPSLKVVSACSKASGFEDKTEGKLLRRSKSYSDNSNSQSSGGSIGQIIREFNKRTNYQGLSKKVYTYQQDQPEICAPNLENMIEEGSGFQLPLDSFEKIASNDPDDMDMERASKLRPTDRSNISSTSELEKIREQIWNKECIQFNQEHLSQVKQSEQRSQSNEDHSIQRQREFKEYPDSMPASQEIIHLSKQLLRLEEELEKKCTELTKSEEMRRQFEAKSVEKQIQLLQLLQMHEDAQASLSEATKLVERYRQQAQQQELCQYQLKSRVQSLQKECIRMAEEKQHQGQQYIKLLHDKNQEIYEMARLNQELKDVITSKEKMIEIQSQELEAQIIKHREELNFYKAKLEEDEGFRINLEEASIIRDLIQNQEHLQKVQNQQETIDSLRKQQQASSKIIEQLKKENHKLSQRYTILGSEYQFFEQKFSTLMKEYHQQLQDTPPIPPYEVRVETQVNPISDDDIKAIDSIINYLMRSNGSIEQHSLNFVCAVSRVIRRLQFCENNWNKERIQRQRLTGKLKGLNLSINMQIEKVEEKADKFQKESIRYKQQSQQLANELRKSQVKLNQVRSQLNESRNLQKLEAEKEKNLLHVQNQKLAEQLKKSHCYAKNLEQKLLRACESRGESEEASRLHENHTQSQIYSQIYQRSRIKNFEITSSVVSVSSKPPKMMLPKKIMAPLPPIPTVSALPASLTLDKLLLRRGWWRPEVKVKFILKLVDLCLELVKVSRKLFSLKPCQMMVSGLEGDIEIVVRRQFGNSTQQDENSLLYRAPEVLLGFSETEASYVWSVGVLMDQIWHQKPFYKKISEVLSRKENYEVRDCSLPIKGLLLQILRKNQKDRPSLQEVKSQLLGRN